MSKQSTANLFEINDFREYVQNWVKTHGRGEYRKIAIALSMHSTLVSQVFRGRKCLTEEQASKLCSYMNLSALETDYFLKLVQIERAGSEHLRSVFQRHLLEIRALAIEVKSRVPASKALSERDRALFYSNWQYSVVRLLTSIDEFQTASAIARRLNISVSRAQMILEFLVSRGLCREEKGRFIRSEKNTHVEAGSPLSIRHHQNWRAKSFELHEKMTVEDLAFTAPISISSKDIPKVRKILLEAIAEISKLVEASSPEEITYLGIDWLRI